MTAFDLLTFFDKELIQSEGSYIEDLSSTFDWLMSA